MTCQDVRDQLGEYLTDALDPTMTASIGRHVGSCVGCRRELDAYRALEGTLGMLAVRPVTALRAPRRFRGIAVAAASLLLGVTVGHLATTSSAREQRPTEILPTGAAYVRVGEVSAASRHLAAGARLPVGIQIEALVPTTVALAVGADASLAPGASVTLTGDHDAALTFGTASVAITRTKSEPFVLTSPVGRFVSDEGLVHAVVERRGDDVLLSLTLVSGSGKFAANDTSKSPVVLSIGELVLVGVEGVRPSDDAVEPMNEGCTDTAQVAAALRVLEERLELIQQENARLRNELAFLHRGRAAVVLPEVMARLEAMAARGRESFLDLSRVNDVVHDLRELGDEGLRALLVYLRSSRVNERLLAAGLLQSMESPAAVQPLLDVVRHDPDESVALTAVSALVRYDDPAQSAAVLEALRSLLDHEQKSVQRVAVFGLVRRGDPEGFRLAAEIIDGDERGSSHFMQNLLILNSPEVLPLVEKITLRRPENPTLLKRAIEYYERLGTPEARARLQSLSLDALLPQSLRDRALEALSF